MSSVIVATSYNNTDFYYNQWNGEFIQSDKVDLSSLNFHSDKEDIPFAQDIATQYGLTNVQLKALGEDFTIN